MRPRTLPLALVPVFVGSAAGAAASGFRLLPALAATVAAVAIQIGTNLANDVGDFDRGGDRASRLGPPRAAANGWLAPRAIRLGAWTAFAVAAGLGLYLVRVGGWPILAIGLASILAGLAYSWGPRPIAYSPFGEVFVVSFFGLVATAGSAYLQAGRVPVAAWWAGLGLGLVAAAVLIVNNTRDIAEDRAAGRRTLAVLLGGRAMRALYAAVMVAALAASWPIGGAGPWAALAASPVAAAAVATMLRVPAGAAFNPLLGRTVLVHIVYGLALALLLSLDRAP